MDNPSVAFEKAFRDRLRSVFAKMGIDQQPVVQRPRSGHADLCLVTFPVAKATGDPPQKVTEEILAEMGLGLGMKVDFLLPVKDEEEEEAKEV